MASAPSQRPRAPRNSRHVEKRFVLKPPAAAAASATNPTTAAAAPRDNSNAPLTSALRGYSPTTSTRIRGGDRSFVNYLPQDEAVASGLGAEKGALDTEESQMVVDLLNAELSRLLKMSPKEFWREVASSDSLHEFLDCYLLFRNRWYDFPHRGARGTVAGVIVGESELCRRIFMVLYRISSNRDPGVKTGGFLSAKEHTGLLQDKKVLAFPKLLDICAIYGHDNSELARLLVINAINSQPELTGNIRMVVSQFIGIVHTMHERCSLSLEVLISAERSKNHQPSQICKDFLEVIDFVNDAVVTLDAFADAYRPAALYLSETFDLSAGDTDLLNTLARLHDLLLPALRNGFAIVSNEKGPESENLSDDVFLSLKLLSQRLVKFGWKLLEFCYLNDVAEGNLFQTVTKMFPGNVEDPAIRGDILLETLKGISGEVPYLQDRKSYGSFLHNLEKSYDILSRISVLCKKGWIVLEEQQFHYISQIAASSPLVPSGKDSRPPFPSLDDAEINEGDVIQESKISQIKEIFPEYGKGFLSACLEAYDKDPEEVIRRILEGTLHEDLQSLSISMEQPPQKEPVSSSSKEGKGKSIVIESTETQTDASSVNGTKGKRMLSESTLQSDFMRRHVAEGPSRSTSDAGGGSSSSYSSSSGRFIRKTREEVLDSEVLDSSIKGDVKAAVLAAVSEYDDEYDDSFDELGLGGVESTFEETEGSGDRASSSPWKSSERENNEGSSHRNAGPKWGSQKKTQFYVKDGKNYSYKVSGSVAVSSAHEADVVNQAQKDVIHGLGRGGNFPFGAVKVLRDVEEHKRSSQESAGATEYHRHHNPRIGRGGYIKTPPKDVPKDVAGPQGGPEAADATAETPGRGHHNPQGRGGRRGGGRHHQRDRAMKKHISGLGGF